MITHFSRMSQQDIFTVFSLLALNLLHNLQFACSRIKKSVLAMLVSAKHVYALVLASCTIALIVGTVIYSYHVFEVSPRIDFRYSK